MNMEITAIDDRGVVGWLAAASHIGEVYMTDVESMVDNVLADADGRRISRLNIGDHGDAWQIQIGDDRINLGNLHQFEAQLQRLQGHFTADGFVHLQHCDIGQNQPLLRELARIWQVPVYAGTGDHNPVYRINRGEYVRCNPDGTCAENVDRPRTPAPATRQPARDEHRYLGYGAHVGSDGIIRQAAGPKL
jgi:hypothetical protein